jgi:hypothetical protein
LHIETTPLAFGMSSQQAPTEFQINEGRSRPRSKRKLDLYRLALADKDVRAALYACNAFLDLIHNWTEQTISYPVSDAFISSIVTCYARPFTFNDFPGVLPKPWRKFSDPRLQNAHHEMVTLRHELFAHSDPTIHTMQIIPAGCYMAGVGRNAPRTSYLIRSQLIPPPRVVGFRDTCADLQGRLEKAISELVDELYDGMDLPQRAFPFRFNEGL